MALVLLLKGAVFDRDFLVLFKLGVVQALPKGFVPFSMEARVGIEPA